MKFFDLKTIILTIAILCLGTFVVINLFRVNSLKGKIVNLRQENTFIKGQNNSLENNLKKSLLYSFDMVKIKVEDVKLKREELKLKALDRDYMLLIMEKGLIEERDKLKPWKKKERTEFDKFILEIQNKRKKIDKVLKRVR